MKTMMKLRLYAGPWLGAQFLDAWHCEACTAAAPAECALQAHF